jgi:outer membrane protein assembly factor BamA
MIRLLPVLCIALSAVDGQDCFPPQPEKTIPAPIRLITFSNAALLPQEKQQEIAQIYRDEHVSPGSLERDVNDFAEEFGERVRAEYQNMGYFKVEVMAQALKTADEHVYDLEAQVRSIGPQYRLGDIRFLRTTVFPVAELREQFAIGPGEVFSRVKVAEGLEKLRYLYGSQGYVNYSPVPMTEFDDEKDVVNLTINSDEGKQFRVGEIEILGVDNDTKARALSELAIKTGDIFNPQKWNAALGMLPGLMMKLGPDTVVKRLDEKNGRVNVLLDFGKPGCPAAGASAQR